MGAIYIAQWHWWCQLWSKDELSSLHQVHQSLHGLSQRTPTCVLSSRSVHLLIFDLILFFADFFEDAAYCWGCVRQIGGCTEGNKTRSTTTYYAENFVNAALDLLEMRGWRQGWVSKWVSYCTASRKQYASACHTSHELAATSPSTWLYSWFPSFYMRVESEKKERIREIWDGARLLLAAI